MNEVEGRGAKEGIKLKGAEEGGREEREGGGREGK